MNAGAWESSSPDSSQFPPNVIGNNIPDSNEKWLDVANYNEFSSILEARFDLAVSKGCHAIDADNVNVFAFPN
jgi:hypothetical protein